MISQAGIVAMRLLARLPLGWVRFLGWMLGWLLYGLAHARRRVVWTNLQLCFPHWSEAEVRAAAHGVFVHFAQAWLDRSWLWHGSAQVVRKRLRLHGALHELQDGKPVVVFAPHFVGLDAGWTCLALELGRPLVTIYSNQADPVLDAWILRGRKRYGQTRLFGRADGLKPVVRAVQAGQVLYLLPDMNITRQESVFVPFFGVPAATLTSLSRFASLGRAKVVPITTTMTRTGYDVQVRQAWSDFPGQDLPADAALMNKRLQAWISEAPTQYYWVHKRFKVRPPGSPAVY